MSTAMVRLVTNRETDLLEFQILDKEALRQEINDFTTWGIRNEWGTNYIPCPKDVAEHLINDPSLALPPARSIADTPFFDKDGNLVTTTGYHRSSRIYLQPRPGFQMPAIPSQPTRSDVERALNRLMGDVFGDFPFEHRVSLSSRAHLLTMLLQSFVRELIRGPTPIYGIVKPQAGTGASLMVDVFSQIAFGTPGKPQSEKNSPEEFRKSITASLMAGARVYWIDNLHKPLDDPSFAAATTTDYWKDRVLGQSKEIEVPVRCTWICSGNNVGLSSELGRRPGVDCCRQADGHSGLGLL